MTEFLLKKKTLIFFFIITLIINFGIKAYSYNNYNYYNINSNNELTIKSDEEVLFILDYSNSMNGRMGYTSKLIITIDILREILNKLENNIKVGLRIFGFSESSYIAENIESLYEKEICSASKLIAPISTNNKDYILNSFNRYTTRGASPIGFSLRNAVTNDFSKTAKMKHIILITDGVETCGDNPCEFIKEFIRTHHDYIIDVIGITIKENDYSQLKCLADYGNGNYYPVNNTDDFNKIFNTIKIVPPPAKTIHKPLTTEKNLSKSNITYKNYLFEFKD